jgi:hypothetical protein
MATNWIARQWSPLNSCRSITNALPKIVYAGDAFSCAFRSWACVVVCELYPQLAGVFALAIETLPKICLASARMKYIFQRDPSFSNEICPLILAEYRDLERVIVGRIMDCKSKFLIPSWSLPASLVGFGLLCFLPKASRTVRILLSHCLPVRKILRPVDDQHQCPNLRSIHRHVCKETRRMRIGTAEAS